MSDGRTPAVDADVVGTIADVRATLDSLQGKLERAIMRLEELELAVAADG
jgi:hypothetical protein